MTLTLSFDRMPRITHFDCVVERVGEEHCAPRRAGGHLEARQLLVRRLVLRKLLRPQHLQLARHKCYKGEEKRGAEKNGTHVNLTTATQA